MGDLRVSSAKQGQSGLIAAAWSQYERVRGAWMLPSIAGPVDMLDVNALPVDAIPGYRLVAELHRGGQGVVYLAFQESTRRKLAVKVPREGPFATAVERARFEREIDVLTRLDHPNIATIRDRGQAGGRAYYVMDYVPGRALDTHVAGGGRTIPEVLRLFVKICDAINAAHLRGVIHRDLKPGNIRIDEQGEPHILDFGLAKCMGDDSVDNVEMRHGLTATGQFLGSIPWASPEQTAGSADQIDVRTDVYALGMMLYQALTGRFPYPVAGRMHEVMENIRNVEPVRPRDIKAGIDDEVETIVLKCLRKAPQRRYQSAGELARDIRHYLAGEPIEAKRDSTWYVLRKTLGRWKKAVAAAIAFMALSAAAAVTTWVMYLGQVQLRQEAEHSAATAQEEAAKSRRILQVLQEMMESVDPETGRGGDVTMREVMDEFARRTELDVTIQPEVLAAIRETIGRTYVSLGLYDAAEIHLRAALDARQSLPGEHHADVAASLRALASVYHARWKLDEAEPLLRKALALDRERLSPDDPKLIESVMALASLLVERSGPARRKEGEALCREALALRLSELAPGQVDDLIVARCVAGLGWLYYTGGDCEAARPLLEDSLEMRRRLLGDDHPLVARSMTGLAGLLQDMGDDAGAEALFRQGLAVQRRRLGGEHPRLTWPALRLARILSRRGELVEAEALCREAVAIRRSRLGESDPEVAAALGDLASVLKAAGRCDEARRTYAEALDIGRRSNANRREYADNLWGLGLLEWEDGDVSAAEPLLDECVLIRQAVLPPDDKRTAEAIAVLSDCRRRVEQPVSVAEWP